MSLDTPFYRTVLFQIVVVGFVSFTQPGIWNALNNLGAGGAAKPYLINAANALTYGIMVVGCTLAGGLCNKIGSKWTLVIGVILYTPYASSLYCNNRYGIEWYVLFGAALCGIGASLFWASEATIAVGYPSESQRGRMVAIWLGIRNLGPLISGIISVGLNAKGRGAGKVSYTTYLVLIAIQCLGFPISLLLSPPNKVVRPDGTKVPYLKGKNTTVKQELRCLWHVTKTPQFALLIPIFITGIWGSTYQSNYLTTYFSVRSRALAALLTAIANILADVLFGIFTDAKWLGNQARRARVIWAFMAICTTGLWVWQMVVEVNFNRNSTPVDWEGSTGRFNSAFAVLILWKYVQTNMLTITRFFYEAQLAYLYWLVGTYKHVDGTLERTVGVLRTFESLGSCLSYVVGATHWPNLNQGILSFALWMACLIPTTLAVGRVPPQKVEVVLAENHEDISNSETGSDLDHKVQVSLDDASSDELRDNSTDQKRNSLPFAP